MSIETRRLTFSEQELIVAALDFCRYDRIAVPEAEVERIEFAHGPEPSLVLSFRTGGPMDPDRVVLSAGQLVSALAEFCKRCAIPVLRHTEKHLRCEDGTLAMLFRIEHRSQRGIAASL